MKLSPTSLLCLMLVLALFPGCAALSEATNTGAIDAQIDKYFKKSSTVGGSLVIARAGEIVYRRDYGFASKSQKTPVTQDTYFRIASVTKMVSAIGIMQLVEKGLLGPDEDISTYFGYEIVNPNFPKIPITLRQCMSHTTSLSQGGGYSFESRTIHDMLSKEVRRPSNFTKEKPGDHYAYSNFGAGLMGSVMEAVTGVSVNQYMRENVFEPLQIDAAYNAGFLQRPEDIASLYENGKLFKSASKYLSEPYQDFADPERHYRITVGDLFITANDLAKIASLLCDGGSHAGTRLISQESAALMRESQREQNKSVTGESPYGLCVNLMGNVLDGHMVYGHQGMAGGAMCNVFYDPDTQFVLVMLTNGCSLKRNDRIGILPRRLFDYAYPLFSEE